MAQAGATTGPTHAERPQHAKTETRPLAMQDGWNDSATTTGGQNVSNNSWEAPFWGPVDGRKSGWSNEEDALLLRCVSKYGPHRWASAIASSMPGRTGKQCRDRWMYHLAPHLDKSDWSAEEDQRILDAVAAHGTMWAKLVKLFPGRTDNGIKNRWNTLIRKEERAEQRANMVREAAAAHARKMEINEALRLANEMREERRQWTGGAEYPAERAHEERVGSPTPSGDSSTSSSQPVPHDPSVPSLSNALSNAVSKQAAQRGCTALAMAGAPTSVAHATELIPLGVSHELETRAATTAHGGGAPSASVEQPEPPNRCPCGRNRLNIGDAYSARWICTLHGDGSMFRTTDTASEYAAPGWGAWPTNDWPPASDESTVTRGTAWPSDDGWILRSWVEAEAKDLLHHARMTAAPELAPPYASDDDELSEEEAAPTVVPLPAAPLPAVAPVTTRAVPRVRLVMSRGGRGLSS